MYLQKKLKCNIKANGIENEPLAWSLLLGENQFGIQKDCEPEL